MHLHLKNKNIEEFHLDLKSKFAEYIIPYKTKLDCIPFEDAPQEEVAVNNNKTPNAKDPS